MIAALSITAIAHPAVADPRGGPLFSRVVADPTGVSTARAIADANGDGCPDVFAANDAELVCYTAPNWARVTLLVPDVVQHGYAFFRADEIAAGDIDSDGDADVVTRVGDSGDVNGVTVWFENPGDGLGGGVWSMHTIGANQYAKNVAVADVDRDGKLDVITREHTRTQVWFQNSADDWTRTQIDHPAHEGMAIGDLDDDGDPDVVLNGFWLETPADPRAGAFAQHNIDSLWYSGQTGGQSWQRHNAKVAVGDIDGDQRLDVLLAHSELPGFPARWYSAADPVNGPWVAHEITPQCDYCHNLAAGDFDDDGSADVLLGGMPQSQQAGLTIYFGDGGATWNPLALQNEGSYSAVIGDLQLDGDLDIVAVYAWNQGPTEWWVNELYAPQPVADVNGDRVTDLLDLSIVLTNFGRSRVGTSEGDLNGDSLVDLADLSLVLATFDRTECGDPQIPPNPLPSAFDIGQTE
ncbi:MAG: hypothetical protein D6744_17845 [Planctomycetota bacterium]|nr:MAG: hypothetical protein D6744_17845 [Planctomycetota bacterium]